MNTITSQKRKLYEQIYINLTSVQKSYQSLAQYLNKHMASAIPDSKEAVDLLDQAEDNIDIANDNIIKVEDIKFVCSLAILSDGALVSTEELSFVLNTLDELLEISAVEEKSNEVFVINWATKKTLYFKQVKRLLLELLSYKLKRKTHYKQTEIQ